MCPCKVHKRAPSKAENEARKAITSAERSREAHKKAEETKKITDEIKSCHSSEKIENKEGTGSAINLCSPTIKETTDVAMMGPSGVGEISGTNTFMGAKSLHHSKIGTWSASGRSTNAMLASRVKIRDSKKRVQIM